MTKERELLGVALEFLDPRSWVDPEDIYALTIISSEIKELLAQPDINTQYLLDQVARLTAENAMLKEKWLAQPKHTSLELEVADCCGSEDYREGFKDGALYAEKMHGITGVDDE